MKKSPRLLPCLGLAAVLPLSALAQPPTPAPEAKPDAPRPEGNYALTLYPPADRKSTPELAIIVALNAFDPAQDPARLQTSFDVENGGPPRVHFRGALTPQKDGLFLLNYYLENSGATATSGLLLRPGEPVQMIKTGDQYYNLRLERYNPPAPR